jgi:hypothetical protein
MNNIDNTMFFSVSEKDLNKTKKIIRSLDSLRFLNGTPFKTFGEKYQISLSGSVKDFNELSEYLDTIREPESADKKNKFYDTLESVKFYLTKRLGIENAN